jgi:hypothetical protein
MSKEKQVYRNTAEDLKQYITEDKFNTFYNRIKAAASNNEIKSITANSHKEYDNLSEAQKSHIEFFIRSPEITPAIDGYVAAAIPGSDNADGIGLVGYIPTEIE